MYMSSSYNGLQRLDGGPRTPVPQVKVKARISKGSRVALTSSWLCNLR